MKKVLLTLGLLLPTSLAVLAGETGIQWAQPDAKIFASAPLIGAQKFKTFSADLVQIYAALPRTGTPFFLQLPLPDGSFRTFKVRYTPISTAELYRRNPGLETYTFTAEQVGNPGVTAKLDVTPHGFHAMILDGGNQYFIDPYSRATTSQYIVYDKRDMSTEGRQRMVCEMAEVAAVTTPPTGPDAFVSGSVQRDFRVALSCTGEYAQASTGLSAPTKMQVLARMITTLNRVNGVYEKELAMHLTLIPNTDTLIFLDGTTDPFSNNSATALINENQNITTALIGPVDYDLGHVFSTGAGGLASLGVLCSADKAKGVTGSPNPVGDPFDIDYVAHEMGHQMNAQHTFNAATGSCSGNGVASQAFEPGSGSTIMAYAGICGGSDNMQQNSSAYFHTSSLKTIASFLATRTCGLNTPSGNLPPTLPPTVASYSIPFLTPFELIAPTAVTANSSAGAIKYCWEEYDLGSFRSSFPTTIASGPIFRSFPPIDSPTRVFPTPARLVRNTFYYIGEKLPTVSRSLTFRLTVREVRNGLGTINIPDGGDVSLAVINTVDTFQITSFTDPAVILGGNQPAQIQWNVATTNVAPINATTVDIYFSTDSGYTFPYLLKKATPNDGSETVLLPNINTTKGRFKVKATENVFFCLNAVPLTVTETPESIANVVYGKELKLFPVPATNVVTVQNQLKGGEAQLYNMMGQPVWKGTIPAGSSTISVTDLPRGAYYFRFQQVGDTQVATRSLLLQ